MIRAFKVIEGRLSEVQKLEDLNPGHEACWIDLLMPTLEEDRRVEEFLKLSIPTKEDMQEIELSARLYDEDGAEYMTMVAVKQLNLDEPSKTPVTFILHGNTLVTVRYSELISLIQYIVKAQKKNGVSIPNASCIMLDIIEALINRIADSLETLGDEIDHISDSIFRTRKEKANLKTTLLQSAMRQIGAKGDLIGMLRESLATISRLLSHHHSVTNEAAQKSLRIKLGTLNRDVLSLNDHAAFLSGKINFLLEATLGMINLEQNQIIKIFSIAAVVFLPPTLVASIYGMNFKIMPELGFDYGYPMALVLMVISAMLPFLYFKRKGWL